MKKLLPISVLLFVLPSIMRMSAVYAQAQTPTCQNPVLNFQAEQRVSSKTFIKWLPSHCRLVIETWRNGMDCRKVGVTDRAGWDHSKSRSCSGEGFEDVGLTSGSVTVEHIRGAQKGRIEIKIWVPNTGVNKSVFVNVQ